MPTQSGTITNEWQAFWLAIGFLTRIPIPVRINYSQQLMNQCSLYFPMVGLMLGALYAGLFALLSLAWSPLTCILLVLCFHLFITGAFHEDGLADSMDALGGGYTLEKRLEIMKDSRIGTYGTAALVMALALKAALLLDTSNIWLALLVMPAISRITPLLLMAFMPYVTDPEKSKSKPVAESFSRRRLLVSGLFTALVAFLFSLWIPGLWLAALTAIITVALLWGWYLQRQLGGYTGDTLGASVVFCELVLLLGI
ncbi:adenosylcobinamide-GDP ribazoletransferase [Marinobacter sp. F3R11]|uniref:adenosylcobinamide-GDP ribazoletransferase n=1 Tax=Marinobacter sp. F3R11 TaxID=2267231 RepID=UPI000DE82FFE|nr:adenosylcobinamide-GDP ribazoletransferase [Marinobacter sp. F3R11]RBW51908.1 adenosylcobinamide-GDP ribazoletransferase [Marinobacter sp. F3R11]